MSETKTMNEEDRKKHLATANEVYDLVVFAKDFVADLDKHMADDGKIDGYEIGMTLLENIPGALASWSGSGKIPDQVKNMTPEAKDIILTEMIEIVQSVAALVEKRVK